MNDFREDHRQFLLLQDRFEKRLFRKIMPIKNAFIKQAAVQFRDTGDFNLDMLSQEHLNKVEAALNLHYEKVIPAFAESSLKNITKKSIKAQEDDILRLIERWIALNGLRQARLIADTTKDDILNAIVRGIREGEGRRQIARMIASVTSISRARSQAIAITETHNAATFGSIESVKGAERNLGLTLLKFWVPTLDERTRTNHAAMASHPGIRLDEKFTVGGAKMDRPGDPAGGASNVIRCRCALVYREQEIAIE